jgi:hypothetical protein
LWNPGGTYAKCVENVKSFDEFLERRFPESRRKAYYLMSIHEHLPAHARKELEGSGLDEGTGVSEDCEKGPAAFFKFLPGEERQTFLHHVNEKKS